MSLIKMNTAPSLAHFTLNTISQCRWHYVFFVVRLCVRPVHCVRLSIHDVVSAIFMVYSDGFRQIFVINVSWVKDELIRIWGQKVRVTG